MAGRTEDHLVEIALTTIAAYGSFLLAEHFRLSGVLATMTAGIIIGNIGSPRSRRERNRSRRRLDAPGSHHRPVEHPARRSRRRNLCTKRILTLLEDLAQNRADDYARFWAAFGQVLKEGVGEPFQLPGESTVSVWPGPTVVELGEIVG